MKDESYLLKEFKDSDVSRIRNLIKKDFGSNTKIQVGYKKVQEHQEGEEFEENGKRFIMTNGIKIKQTKLDEIRKMAHIPLICPECSKAMNKPLDKKAYSLHRFCFNCLIEHDNKLVIEGKFQDHIDQVNKKDLKVFIQDVEAEFKEYLENSDESFVTEEGVIEDWVNVDNKPLKDGYQNMIDDLKEKYDTE